LSLIHFNVAYDLLDTSLNPELGEATILLRNLLNNPNFKQNFLNRFADHMNTTFASTRMERIIEETSSAVLPELEPHMHRWGYPTSLSIWNDTVQSYKNWSNERSIHQRQQLVQHLQLDGTASINIISDNAKGVIQINTIKINENTPGIENPSNWTGIYFKEIPIEIKAIPKSGYRFVRWEGIDSLIQDPEKESITLALPNDTTLTVLFEVDTETTALNIADDSLRANIEGLLGKPAGETIYQNEVANIEVLSLSNKNISNIEGLQHFVNLKELDLSYNNITSIDALSGLNLLNKLNLRENKLTNITALNNLTNLVYLNLHTTQSLASVAPIANLINLEELILRNVPLGSEITVLSNLIKLHRTNLRNTGITDVTVLGQLMASGALQDNNELGIKAEIDLRDNNIPSYKSIRPYWKNVSTRDPKNLPEDTVQDECFIATAVFGSKMEPSVILLRKFRNEFLLTNKLGKNFVDFYYQHSPKFASFISDHNLLKGIVRIALLPVLAVAYTAIHFQVVLPILLIIGFSYFFARTKTRV
jgi:hypothetical protein